MLKEFREFALKRNVVDLAVGIIIGAAFRKIVESVAGDLIMPVIGALTGGLDFSNYFTPLTYGISASSLGEARKQGAVLAWGNFITIAINFVIVAFAMFLLVKVIHEVRRREEAKPPPAAEMPQDVKLLTEIRDILAHK